MERDERRPGFPATPLVKNDSNNVMKRKIKSLLSAALSSLLRSTQPLRENLRRLSAHASLAADLALPLPASAVVLGRISVFGSRNIRFGENVLLYPDLHLETQGDALIEIGDDVVISSAGKPENLDGDNYFIRDGVVLIPKGAIIHSGTKI